MLILLENSYLWVNLFLIMRLTQGNGYEYSQQQYLKNSVEDVKLQLYLSDLISILIEICTGNVKTSK